MWGVYCNDFSWGLSWNPLNQNNFIFFVSQIAKNCFVTSGIFYEYFGEFNSPISCRISTKQSGVFLFYNKTCNKRIENTIFRKIYTRNNAVKVYESISGHTDRNPVLVRACFLPRQNPPKSFSSQDEIHPAKIFEISIIKMLIIEMPML